MAVKYVLNLLLICVVQSALGQLVPVCTIYNATVNSQVPGESPLIADIRYWVNNDSIQTGGSVEEGLVVKTKIEYTILTNSQIDPIVKVTKSLELTTPDYSKPQVFIGTEISSTRANSTSPYLKDISFNDDLSGGLWAQLGDGFVPGIMEPGLVNNGRSSITWTVIENMSNTTSYTLQYYADPAGTDMEELPDGKNIFSTILQYSDSTGTKFSALSPEVCLNRLTVLESSLFYQHGFTALSFFMAFLLGIILVIIIVLIIVMVMKKKGLMATSVSPSKLDKEKLKETGKKIVLDAKEAIKKGFNTIKDYSLIGPDDSLVHVLSLKDKLQMFREIDNLDILSTINVDTNIEKEQNDASVQASLMLIHNMQLNNDITKQTEDQVVNNFNNNFKNLDKTLDDDYKKEMEIVLIRLSTRNKEKVGDMLSRHNAEKQEIEDKSEDLSEKEVQEFLEILDKQQQTERNELTYVLALEQNEEAEKLRKEFGIRKRLGIKKCQQAMIGEVTELGKLTHEQANWLLKEHKRQQEAIQQMYDEEISRQRMILEEKLARRRALAEASEQQENDQRDVLNTMAGHQVADINKLKKQNKLSSEEADDMIESVKKDMLAAKEKMDKERERQESELHKKLSALKAERMNNLKKKHDGEVAEYEKRCKEQQTDGKTDPVSVVEGLLKLRSGHRGELLYAELELDNDHSKQLEKVRDILGEKTKDDLYLMEKMLLDKLKNEGLKETEVSKIMKQHEREVAELCESQEEERRRQKEKLMEELARRKKEWDQRKMSEKKEQEELRDYEGKVVEKLISSQMSISEEDRLKIMKEHEQHMIKLENSLTLNKLRQKRMLEERLALKRAQQMDKLQQKQATETQKQKQKFKNNGEEDDEASHQKEIDLMKKHAEQRLAILNGQMLNIDDELNEVRVEMVRERAIALKSQEERLGTMIARLQLEKAKELAKIEEQQKAINSLKINLVDDLNERGILSTPECEKLLEGHRQQKEELERRLDEQKARQEKALRKRLGERVQLREKSIIKQHDMEMQSMTTLSGSKMSAKLKSMMLMHKRMLELEKFRNHMDREISQTLEDNRRKLEIEKMAAVQKQEIEFISKLVKYGHLRQDELKDTINVLFPLKTPEEKNKLMSDLLNESIHTQMSPEQEQLLRSSGPSTLPERVRKMSVSVDLERPPSRALSRKGNDSFNKKKKKLGSRQTSNYSLLDSLDSTTAQSLGSSNFKDSRRFNDDLVLGSKSSKRNLSRTQEDFLHGNQDGYDSERSSRSGFSNSKTFNRGSMEDLRSNGFDNRRTSLNNSRKFDKRRGSAEDLRPSSRLYKDDFEDDREEDRFSDTLRSTGPLGRLPPLQPIQASPTRSKKKKKKLLSKMAHRDDDD